MVVGSVVLKATGTVAGNYDGRDLASAGIGVAAATGVAVGAFVKGDDDGVIAAVPKWRTRDLVDDLLYNERGNAVMFVKYL